MYYYYIYRYNKYLCIILLSSWWLYLSLKINFIQIDIGYKLDNMWDLHYGFAHFDTQMNGFQKVDFDDPKSMLKTMSQGKLGFVMLNFTLSHNQNDPLLLPTQHIIVSDLIYTQIILEFLLLTYLFWRVSYFTSYPTIGLVTIRL